MVSNNTYLIATDGSKYSENAILKGMELAKSMDAKVYVLYVLDTREYVPSMLNEPVPLGSKWDVTEEMVQQEGNDAIKYAKKVAEDKGVECESVILKGRAAHEILEFAEHNKVDMIIVGTLGKGGVERFLLGSVSDKVVRYSPTSVLVVKKKNNV
jgi:nucleotide-binding universal stress UspA family protein